MPAPDGRVTKSVAKDHSVLFKDRVHLAHELLPPLVLLTLSGEPGLDARPEAPPHRAPPLRLVPVKDVVHEAEDLAGGRGGRRGVVAAQEEVVAAQAEGQATLVEGPDRVLGVAQHLVSPGHVGGQANLYIGLLVKGP